MNVIALTGIGWAGGVLAAVFIIRSFVHANSVSGYDFDKESRKLIAIGVLGVVILITAIILYFNFTAVGEQQVQAWSAQSAGIQRKIEVYSMTGEKISEYSGVFNIEYDDNRVEIYDTEKGERIIIYYKNGTIIVTEPNVKRNE